jgi:hypothetical protein
MNDDMTHVDIIAYVVSETDADGTTVTQYDAANVVRLFGRFQRISMENMDAYGVPWVYGVRKGGTLTAPLWTMVHDASKDTELADTYRVEIRHPDGVRVSGIVHVSPNGRTSIHTYPVEYAA